MRYGAAILFVIAALQLLIGIIIVVQTLGVSGNPAFAGTDGASSLQGLVIMEGLIRVFTTAALPFFGALVINRLDKRSDPRQAEPFE
ncbi:hypothetical protein [Allosphingosinicella sp.]|uniref:hypothetical protein n=1 Tax=Allosphingosinicella sp. TaxID=2823234 RepID=UPI00378466BC